MAGQNSEAKTIDFQYIFKFIDGNSKTFNAVLDASTLRCIMPEGSMPPDWANLLYFQCDNCPLDHEEHKNCPIAANIGTLIDAFKDVASYETAHVLVITRQRDFSKTTTVQEGLGSLLGIYMVTSGCPVMEKLKPLVRFHLPFCTLEETAARVASTYLLIQYFLMKKGAQPDWKFEKLDRIYEEIHRVNLGLSRRLQHAAKKDAGISAIESLDCFASLLPLVISDTIGEMEESLSSYWRT